MDFNDKLYETLYIYGFIYVCICYMVFIQRALYNIVTFGNKSCI